MFGLFRDLWSRAASLENSRWPNFGDERKPESVVLRGVGTDGAVSGGPDECPGDE